MRWWIGWNGFLCECCSTESKMEMDFIHLVWYTLRALLLHLLSCFRSEKERKRERGWITHNVKHKTPLRHIMLCGITESDKPTTIKKTLCSWSFINMHTLCNEEALWCRWHHRWTRPWKYCCKFAGKKTRESNSEWHFPSPEYLKYN